MKGINETQLQVARNSHYYCYRWLRRLSFGDQYLNADRS